MPVNRDLIQLIATYLVAVLILIGAFILIFAARGDSGQAWLAIGTVLGYIFRDAGGDAATRSVERIQASQPTMTTSGNPPITTVTPANGN